MACMGIALPLPSRRWRLVAVVLIATLAGAAAVQASTPATPPPVRDASLKEVGRGRLTWFGLRIYEASLWSPDGQFGGFEPGRPVALSLAYERGFSRADLIKITTGEFARLGLADEPARMRWSAALGALWRDVGPGDTLTALVVPGGATRFYDGARLLGAIEDPAFGPAYLSIWLDARSAVRDLRAQLLGLKVR
jgi:hypothetical protein